MPRAAPRDRLASVHIHLLGPLAIQILPTDSRGGSAKGSFARLPTRKAESLLAYLILHPESHSREKLAAQFWGDTSDIQARASLRNALVILRAHLGDKFLIASRDQVQLNPGYPLWVDVREFQGALTTAPQAAVELYGGPLLVDSYDDWVIPERDALHALYVDALLRLCQQTRAGGEHQRTIELAQLVLKADPANEQAHQHLMFSFATLGNRSAALRQYEECRRLLEEELGVEPAPETTALYKWIQRAPSERRSLASRPTNLPILLTSFIGRRPEVQAVKDIVSTSRLLTITGAGGSGKTRLAIQAAEELADAFPDGVWWIDLAALNDERFVPSRVASTLGILQADAMLVTETIISHLRTGNVLLVMDNCEHLIGACARLITALLSACPGLKIIITSREGLGVFGERIWPAPGMLTPDAPASMTLGELQQFDGIRLFLERAVAIRPDFSLDQGNAIAVAEICRRLDGIPLAIEMAAARVAVLPVQEIASRLGERFSFLTTGDRVALPRHQTLRATMDWSYNLLSLDEQRLLRELSVFAGGFTVEAAESVCPGGLAARTQVVDLLSLLASKSLISIEAQAGEPRFRMLETILEYAREKLEKEDAAAVRQRHLQYFSALADRAEPVLWGAAEQAWVDRLEAEQDNMRAALRFSASAGLVDQNMRLANALMWFWYVHSNATEGRQWLEQALVSATTEPVPDDLMANTLMKAGALAVMQGDYPRASTLLELSRRKFEGVHNYYQLAWVFHQLGQLALFQGDYSLAAEWTMQSLNLFEQLSASAEVASLKAYLGMIVYYQGNDLQARALLEESLPVLKQAGDTIMVARALHGLGLIELKGGDHDRAEALFRDSLLAARPKDDRWELIKALEGLGAVAFERGLVLLSATLLGAADAQRSLIRFVPEPGVRSDVNRTLAALRGRLDGQAFAKAWEEGVFMSMDQAVEFALSSEHT